MNLPKHPTTIGRFMVAMLGIIEHEATGNILLLKRSDYEGGHKPDIWEIPGGRMDQHELPHDALRRELKEETGLELSTIHRPLTAFHYYRGEKTAENEVIGVVWWVSTTKTTVTLSEEHTDFAWLTIEEALERATDPGVRHDLELFAKEKRASRQSD